MGDDDGLHIGSGTNIKHLSMLTTQLFTLLLCGNGLNFFINSSGGPIYEVPKGTYSGEQVLDILLDPEVDTERICRERPRNVTESCTFVVDLYSLKHPDDIKKDEFGKWHYNGSHVVSYTAWKSQSSSKFQFERVSGHGPEKTFELCRIRCKHPSNPQFQRLLAFVTGKCIILCSVTPCRFY